MIRDFIFERRCAASCTRVRLLLVLLFFLCPFQFNLAFQEETQHLNPAVTGTVDGVIPLSSDADHLGLNIAAPYSSVNEFTGKLQVSLDPIGVPELSIRPIYKAYQQKVCNDESGFRLCPMNEPDTDSVLGEGWNLHFGYIIARNAIYGAPGSSDWERVRFVDTAGNVTTFGRDGVFQADPQDGGASDNCAAGGCIPNQADVHFIDDQLRRISRGRRSDGTSLQGFSYFPYVLSDPNGQKTEYRATRYVTNPANAGSVTFYPTRIWSPSGRILRIDYVGGTDPDGTLPDFPRIDRITDENGRSLVFHYLGALLERITLEAGLNTKLLKRFTYRQVFAGDTFHTTLHKVITPEGYETVFTMEDVGEPKPLLTALTLPTGGTVHYQYDTQRFEYLQPDAGDCTNRRVDDCVTLEPRYRFFNRISGISHGGGHYAFDYRQWSAEEERQSATGQGALDVTVTQTNGAHAFQRTTTYINTPLFETNYRVFTDGYLVGRPRSKQTTYRGTTLNESWRYTPELSIAAHAGGDNVSVSAVRQYAQQIDGQWIDTNYDYSWFESGNWQPSNFREAFLQPVKITRQARGGNVSLVREFDYDHRFVANFGWDDNTTLHQYALALLTSDQQTLVEVDRETLLGRTSYRYEGVNVPFPTKVEHWQDSTTYRTERYSYIQEGNNRGRLRTAKRLGQRGLTTYNSYQYGQASSISLPEGESISRTVDFDGTLANETINGVTTVYGYDADLRLTSVQVPATAPLITEFSPPGTLPATVATFYELGQGLRLAEDQPFPIATRTIAERVPVETVTLDDWGRVQMETRQTSPSHIYTRTHGYSPLGTKETLEAENGRWTYHLDVFGRPIRAEHHDIRDGLLLLKTDFQYETKADGATVVTETTEAQTRDYSSLPIEPRLPGTRVSTVTRTSETDLATRLVRAETNGQPVIFDYAPHTNGVEITTRPYDDPSLERVTVTNLLGDLVAENHPEIEHPIHYDYDADGLLEEQYHGGINDKKMRRVFRYDDAGRLIEKLGSTLEAPGVLQPLSSFSFDPLGRLIEATQFNNHQYPVTITYDAFDSANRVQTYQVFIPQIEHTDFSSVPYRDLGGSRRYRVSLNYEALGRVSAIQHANGGYTGYSYEFDASPFEVFYGFGPAHPQGPDFVQVIDLARFHPYNGNNLSAAYDLDRCQSKGCNETLRAMAAPELDQRHEFDGQVFTTTDAYLATFEQNTRSFAQYPDVPFFAIQAVDSLGRPRLHRLFDILSTGDALFTEAYIQYNAFGFVDHLIRRDNLFSSRLFFYDYTELGQLAKLSMGPATVDYRYDPRGNLISRSGLSVNVGGDTLQLPSFSASYSEGNPYHHDGDGMDYDGVGRLTRNVASEHHYDAAGFFELVKQAGTTSRSASKTDDWEEYYLYDAFGQRVAKWETASNKVTYSVRDLNGAILTEEDFSTAATNQGQLKTRRQYILFDGKAVYTEETSFSAKGTQTDRKETYRFHDRLGNPAVTWDADLEQPQSQFYEPYGTPTVSSVKTKGAHGFTGHDEDNTGLVYMKARYYEPRMGCFLQPDEARDFNPFLPNSYNLYSYTYQNPANAYDPDGNAVETAWDVANIGIGVASFVYNVSEGNWLDATIDAGGVIIDTAAAATPFVPGGAGAVIKAARAGDKIKDASNVAVGVSDARQAAKKVTPDKGFKTKKKGPKPNNGEAKPHGGRNHNNRIDDRIRELKQDADVENIRKNQEQVDVDGNKVGRNRPDIQYDKNGCHHCVEYDKRRSSSVKHGETIKNNDPNTEVELNAI